MSITVPKKRGIDIAEFFGKSVKVQKKETHTGSPKETLKETLKETVKQTSTVVKSGSKVAKSEPHVASSVGWDKDAWEKSLSDEQRQLLRLEIDTMDVSWLSVLYRELTKPYFLELKRFLAKEFATQTVFPPQQDIYSWTRLTPLDKVKVLILGQDPYHNHGQAHGLAFSVKDPKVAIPPSLRNMYKTLKTDYPAFEIPKTANLTKWTQQGVLLLNTCLTVRAHQANSHSGKGWEQLTTAAIGALIRYADSVDRGIVVLAWGSPAQKTLAGIRIDPKKHCVLRTVHPSPLSARRGYFDCEHYKKCNAWLQQHRGETIDWAIVDGNTIKY